MADTDRHKVLGQKLANADRLSGVSFPRTEITVGDTTITVAPKLGMLAISQDDGHQVVFFTASDLELIRQLRRGLTDMLDAAKGDS